MDGFGLVLLGLLFTFHSSPDGKVIIVINIVIVYRSCVTGNVKL